MDGDFISPMQIRSNSSTGPVLLAFNWLDAVSVRKHHATLAKCGYLETIPFNRVVDAALKLCSITRANIYITQVFHLLPLCRRSGPVPQRCLDASFQEITQHELAGRKFVALGVAAAQTCRRHGLEPDQVVNHPSARGRTIEGKAAQLAQAIAGREELEGSRPVANDTLQFIAVAGISTLQVVHSRQELSSTIQCKQHGVCVRQHCQLAEHQDLAVWPIASAISIPNYG